MRHRISLRDFGAGAVFGLLLGTAGLGAAAFGYDGWNRFSQDFKVGYVTGFMGMANLARNLEPGGWVDSKYPQVPKAKPTDWAAAIDELYRDPERQRYSMTAILQSAAKKLEDKFGKAMAPDERARQRMLHQLGLVKKRREAMGLHRPKPGEAPAPKPDPKLLEAPEKKVKASPPEEEKGRKWCRCDGKNPKEERAKRRARAEAEKAAAAKAASPAASHGSAPGAAPEAPKQPPAPAKK